ncbi:unnamed protein product [Mytilus coruscus]|uniref:Uncharacterized protein n=1 Tax=Mytilus coruscus TaxID=42192 RepID=A0A6J8F3L9_MYTCO|nr:unnamed protein product [Mytilus coruscus]
MGHNARNGGPRESETSTKDLIVDDTVRYRCCFTGKYIRNEYNDSDLCQCPHCYADLYLNFFCKILVFITICANIGITGIGITGDYKETIEHTVNNNITDARRTGNSLMSTGFRGNNGLDQVLITYVVATLIYVLEIIVPDKTDTEILEKFHKQVLTNQTEVMSQGKRTYTETEPMITRKENKIDFQNRFSESKKYIQNIADVSLMMANISQLRAVLGFGKTNTFYIHLLTLISVSLVSHTVFVFVSVIRGHFIKKHHISLVRAKKNLEKISISTCVIGTPSPITDEPNLICDNDNNQPTKQENQYANKEISKPTTEQGTSSINAPKRVRFCCCCTKQDRLEEYDDSDHCQCPHCHTDLYLGYVCNILVFITICANIGITGIGIIGDCKPTK